MASHTVYAVASGKGGVGKTTTTVNLGASLAAAGHTVAIVDTDLGMANLGGFAGLGEEGPTLHEVLAGEVPLREAVYEAFNGLAVVPSGISLNGFANVETGAIADAVDALRDAFDYVILDLGAGLSHDTVLPLALADAVVLVSTPEPLSIQDTAKTREVTEHLGGQVAGVVLTRADRPHELDLDDIREDLGLPVLAVIPETAAAPASARAAESLLEHAPDNPATEGYRGLGRIVEEESLEFAPVVPEVPGPEPEPAPADRQPPGQQPVEPGTGQPETGQPGTEQPETEQPGSAGAPTGSPPPAEDPARDPPPSEQPANQPAGQEPAGAGGGAGPGTTDPGTADEGATDPGAADVGPDPSGEPPAEESTERTAAEIAAAIEEAAADDADTTPASGTFDADDAESGAEAGARAADAETGASAGGAETGTSAGDAETGASAGDVEATDEPEPAETSGDAGDPTVEPDRDPEAPDAAGTDGDTADSDADEPEAFQVEAEGPGSTEQEEAVDELFSVEGDDSEVDEDDEDDDESKGLLGRLFG